MPREKAVQRLLSSGAVQAFAFTRGILLVATFLGLRLQPQLFKEPWRAFPDLLWFDGWARWDSVWYWTIVDEGYEFVPHQMSNVAFFPLYPLVVKACSFPARLFLDPQRAFLLTGIVLSHVFFLVALIGLERLASLLADRATAQRTVWLTCSFPFALFYSAAYTESLFLALAVWSTYLARRQYWGSATILAATCAVSRTVGGVIVIALLIEYVRRHEWEGRALLRGLILAAVGFAGLGLLLIYFWAHFGDPFVFAQAHSVPPWGRRLGLGHLSILVQDLFRPRMDVSLTSLWYLVLIPVCCLLAVHVTRRWGPAIAALTIGILVPSLFTGAMSIGRLVSVIFPLFLSGAFMLRRSDVLRAVCAFFIAQQILMSYWFAHWGNVF